MFQDLRSSIRLLWRRRRASLLTLAVLTLGIGLATAMFSILDGVLLRGLPFPDGDRVVLVSTYGGHDRPMPAQDFLDLREDGEIFAELGAFRTYNSVVTRPGHGSKGLTATYVTGNLFQLLGAEPFLGRTFTAEDEDPSAPPVAMLSYRVWQSQFGGDPEVVGKALVLNRETMTIIGVMPAGFHFPIRQEAWAALRWDGRSWSKAGAFAIGKLRPGASPRQSQREMAPFVAALDGERPMDGAREAFVTSYVDALLPPTIQRALGVMMAAVLAVLLVACVNTGSLRVGDTLARNHELAVRRALGARGRHLLRLLLSEAAVLVAASVALGLALAWGLVKLASGSLLQGSLLVRQFWIDVQLDIRSCVFAVAIATLAVTLGGLLPALWSARQSRLRAAVWSASAQATSGRRAMRLSLALVAWQVAVCFALVLGAGLLVRSGLQLLAPRPGFETENLMRVMVSTHQADLQSAATRRAFWDRLLEGLDADPELSGATLSSAVPWARWSSGVPVRSRVADAATAELPPDELPRAQLGRVLPDFLQVLGLPLLSGRSIERSDVLAREGESPPEMPAVVSASFARHHFGEDAIGRSFEWLPTFGDRTPVRATVVGVVVDSGLGRQDRADSEHAVYAPFSFAQSGAGFLLLRGRRGTAGVVDAVDRQIRRLDPRVATLDERTFEQERAEQTWAQRRLAQLLTFFAATTLLLSGIGLYGALALSLRRRLRELAIRSALGARPGDLRGLLLREGGRCALAGTALGALLAAAAGPYLERFLYQTSPFEPTVTAAALAAVAVVTLIAILGPANRAARTDPLVELHSE